MQVNFEKHNFGTCYATVSCTVNSATELRELLGKLGLEITVQQAKADFALGTATYTVNLEGNTAKYVC